MKIAIGILLLLQQSVQSVPLQQRSLGQIKDSNIITDSQKAEAHNNFDAALELEQKDKRGFNDTKKYIQDIKKQQLAQAFSNKTTYEMQAEEMDREEETAGAVVYQDTTEVLHQANSLMQKNTTAAYQDHNDESLWQTKAQKNVDDFDAYSNFMNSKFGSAPAIEQAKIVEIKKDNSTQNITKPAVQQQSQQNQTKNITANVTNMESSNATSYNQSFSDPTIAQVATQSLTNITKNLDFNSTAEKIKTMKVNETMVDDSPSQMHHIVDQVLKDSENDKDLDDVMKRVQTEDEKEQKFLGEIKTEQSNLKQNLTQNMQEIEKEEQQLKENQSKKVNSTDDWEKLPCSNDTLNTTSLPQKKQTANVTSNTTTASQNNQTLQVDANLTAALKQQNQTVMEQAMIGVIQKFAAKQEEKTQGLIKEQNDQLQDIENRLLEKQLTKTAERRVSVSFGGGIAQAAGQALLDEEEAKDDILSSLTEISGLDGEDRKKVFALAQEGLKN